jgi:hypothetical protein
VKDGSAVVCRSFLFLYKVLERKLADNYIICSARKSSPECCCLSVAVSLFPTQSSGDGDYKTGGNACHDLGYEYADGTWIVDAVSPDHVYLQSVAN